MSGLQLRRLSIESLDLVLGSKPIRRRFESWARSFTTRCLKCLRMLLVCPKKIAVGVKPKEEGGIVTAKRSQMASCK